MIKFYFLFFLLISSCGKKILDQEEIESFIEENPDGSYYALLNSINPSISNEVSGEVKILKYDDEFKVFVSLKNAPKGKYFQHLHTGSFCPQMEHDMNADGVIDSEESSLHTGQILVPFDEDLSAQENGLNFYLSGNYTYNKSTSYYLMLLDLHLPDNAVDDDMVKLNEKDLLLERKVVAVYASETNRPHSLDNLKVPIVCGILTRISDENLPSEVVLETSDGRESRNYSPRREETQEDEEIDNEPNPPTEYANSWWDRIRQRWRRWRR